MNHPILLLALLVWGAALVGLCSRRDIDIHTKISWIVIVLVFNVIGAIAYFLFGPKSEKTKIMKPETPEHSEPITPEHMQSWNPIIGYNSGKNGEGLNPKDLSSSENEKQPNQ